MTKIEGLFVELGQLKNQRVKQKKENGFVETEIINAIKRVEENIRLEEEELKGMLRALQFSMYNEAL